ncbi:MAG: hypothetical protein KY475_09600 [Planctomycetes bacterium]|nr:hypothetical protein [Planctomycetota bacterium]
MVYKTDADSNAVLLALGWLVFAVGCNSQEVDVSGPPTIKGATRTITFADGQVGTTPPGWSAEQTGKGEGSKWQIVADDSAPSGTGKALAQLVESPRSMFNLCILDEGKYGDLKLSVAFKAIAGEVDQGGGLVWRYVDANNYYICRFNPLESNLRVYKVIAGKRKHLTSTDVEAAAGAWHTLTATMKGDLMVCTLGDAQVAARDETLRDAGRIGLWTKADAQTYFDDFAATGPSD